MSDIAILKSAGKPRLSYKAQTAATISAIIGAVALPQVFHLLGMVSGLGTVPGEVFLPMHIPVILVGLLAGPFAGAISGLLGPVVSFLLCGMPGAAMLPFMMTELCAYGLMAGLLRNVKMPCILKVLAVQVFGRAIRACAILAAVYVFGSHALNVSVIWTSIATGLIGLVLQWALIPLLVYYVEDRMKHDK